MRAVAGADGACSPRRPLEPEGAAGTHRSDLFTREHDMNANTHLVHAIADALIEAHGEDAIDWLEGEGRAAVERGVAGWRAAIAEGAWIDRPADILVLRALRHVEHVVELEGGAGIEARVRALADEDRRGRRPGAKARIGEVFAHELLRGDTGEPFESIEYAFREHGDAIRGEDDEHPWNAAAPLSGAETRVEVCLVEARYVERRVPFVDLPESVRRAKAAVDAGDESGWTPVADGPVFRYVRALREDGAERTIPPDLQLRTLYTVELVCAPGRSVVLVEEGLRGRLEDVASKAIESARVSKRWRVDPGEPIFVRRIRYDLDEWSDLRVPEGYRVDPFRDSG